MPSDWIIHLKECSRVYREKQLLEGKTVRTYKKKKKVKAKTTDNNKHVKSKTIRQPTYSSIKSYSNTQIRRRNITKGQRTFENAIKRIEERENFQKQRRVINRLRGRRY